MTKFLTGVLSVIAAGVLLIAYGLFYPRAAAFDAQAAGFGTVRPTLAGEQIMLRDNPYAIGAPDNRGTGNLIYPAQAPGAYAYVPYSAAQPDPRVVQEVRPVQTVSAAPAPRREVVRTRIAEKPRRNWKKTALVIGGSSAAGAGVGAIFGGKKGALIGAAIGGGASTIYETTRK
jgi:hypothetical protein